MGFNSQEIESYCQEAIELQHVEIVISVLNHKICRLLQKKTYDSYHILHEL